MSDGITDERQLEWPDDARHAYEVIRMERNTLRASLAEAERLLRESRFVDAGELEKVRAFLARSRETESKRSEPANEEQRIAGMAETVRCLHHVRCDICGKRYGESPCDLVDHLEAYASIQKMKALGG